MNKFILSLTTLILLSCNSDEISDTIDGASAESPLSISVSTTSFETKGALVTTEAEMGSIGLYCAMTEGGYWTDTTTFSKMVNRCYSYSEDTGWDIEGDPESWGYESTSDKYTIVAYSPYNDDADGISPSISNGELVIEYSVPLNSAKQPDLMYAAPVKDFSPQGLTRCVPLTFYHTLACISFEVISSNDISIDAIDVTGVRSKGSVTWSDTESTFVWSIPGSTDDSYTYDTFSVEVDDYKLDKSNSVRVNSDRGYMMMIPQSLPNGADITLSLSNSETRELKIPAGSEWLAGGRYTYVITLSDCDDEDEVKEKNFIYDSSQISNCYIINPTAGEETVVQIPVEDRINDFWENYTTSGNTKIKNGTKNLSAVTVWDDFFLDDKTVPTFELFEDTDDDGKVAVRIIFPADYQEGNFVFAIEKKDNRLWSWHLWFTSYDPDAIAEANIGNIEADVDRAYTYGDYNGAVHRYKDDPNLDPNINPDIDLYVADSAAVWRGIYKDKFIMDRNIGERNDNKGLGSLYYQFGRKDPFPSNYGSDPSGISILVTSSAYFYEAVENSFKFYMPSTTSASRNWCGETAARIDECIWFDKDISAIGYEGGKSIFDPSPLGWRVPVNATWNYFNELDPTKSDTTQYFSVGVYNLDGFRNGLKLGKFTVQGTAAYVWGANRMDPETGYCLYYSKDEAKHSQCKYMSDVLPVRPIQE